MGRFDRYVLAQLTVVFGFSSLVLVLVYWINRAVILFDQLIADGQSATVFLEFTALSLPNIIRMVLPIAAFAAALYVTQRLAADSELTVVQATGFSPFRLARPVLAFGLGVTGLTLMLTHVLVPAAQGQLREREAEIAETATARLLREGAVPEPDGRDHLLYPRHHAVGRVVRHLPVRPPRRDRGGHLHRRPRLSGAGRARAATGDGRWPDPDAAGRRRTGDDLLHRSGL